VHAIVAQSKSKCAKSIKKRLSVGARLEAGMLKSARRCGTKHMSKIVESCRSQNGKSTTCTDQFWTLKRFSWQAQGIPHLAKSEQNVRVL